MTRDDVMTIQLDEAMVAVAKDDSEFLHKNRTDNTRALREDRDIIGSLGHQAVEVAFDQLGVPYYSSRTERYKHGGDSMDIEYEGDRIDVKATTERGGIEKYFYNVPFLVIQDQLDDPKTELITHFIFVTVEPTYHYAHVYGIIRQSSFLRLSVPRTLKYENREIKSNQLTPLRKYVFKV